MFERFFGAKKEPEKVEVGEVSVTLVMRDGKEIQYGKMHGRVTEWSNGYQDLETGMDVAQETLREEAEVGFFETAEGTWYNASDVKEIRFAKAAYQVFPE